METHRPLLYACSTVNMIVDFTFTGASMTTLLLTKSAKVVASTTITATLNNNYMVNNTVTEKDCTAHDGQIAGRHLCASTPALSAVRKCRRVTQLQKMCGHLDFELYYIIGGFFLAIFISSSPLVLQTQSFSFFFSFFFIIARR